MKVLKTWDELSEVCEELCKKGNRWAKKYYKEAFNHTFLYCRGLRDKIIDSINMLEKLERSIKKQGYILDKYALLEDMLKKLNAES